MTLPPRDVFAAACRSVVEDHDTWDSPHCFETLHWDGAKLHVGTHVVIMADIDPDKYPVMMIKISRRQLEEHPDDPAYAYLLQIESVGKPEQPESAIAWCVDIHGRAWYAAKVRERPGRIDEKYFPPGTVPHGTRMVDALFAVAQSTGMVAYGLPGPPAFTN